MPHFLDILCTMEYIDSVPDRPEGMSKTEMIVSLLDANHRTLHEHLGGDKRMEIGAIRRIEKAAGDYVKLLQKLNELVQDEDP